MTLTFADLGKIARYEMSCAENNQQIDEDYLYLLSLSTNLLLLFTDNLGSKHVPEKGRALYDMVSPHFMYVLYKLDEQVSLAAHRAYEDKGEEYYLIEFGDIDWTVNDEFVKNTVENVVRTLQSLMMKYTRLENVDHRSRILSGENATEQQDKQQNHLFRSLKEYKFMYKAGATPIDYFASCTDYPDIQS